MTSSAASWRALWPPLRVFLGISLIFGCFFSGYMFGLRGNSGISEGILGNSRTIPRSLVDDVDFQQFWDVWSRIREGYVDQPVDNAQLFEGALQGLVSGLHDPYSVFFTKEMAEDFEEEISGSFFGIGAELGTDAEGNLVVVAPIADTPAERAGILAGDYILAIDGEDATQFDVDTAVSRIRGEKGVAVVLTILHKEASEPEDITIIRDEIHIKSVDYRVIDGGIGVITVNIFGDETEDEFAEAADALTKEHVSGIIVDVRNNPGGLLRAALTLAGYWTGDAVVVQEEVRGEKTPLAGRGDARFSQIPTVILVNEGSASASEIFAGALQEYGLAHIVGEQTFGKGSVQEYQDFPDGSALKITVARWLTPQGTSFDKLGVTPNEVVSRTLDDFHEQRDPQFDAALRFLSTK